ncbi:MAG: hypothetical protein V8T36_04760 [Ruthenibacterium lactatiformans]
MKDTIQKELAQIEQTQNVRILLAVNPAAGHGALPLRTATMMYGSSTSARKMRICGFKNTVM